MQQAVFVSCETSRTLGAGLHRRLDCLEGVVEVRDLDLVLGEEVSFIFLVAGGQVLELPRSATSSLL